MKKSFFNSLLDGVKTRLEITLILNWRILPLFPLLGGALGCNAGLNHPPTFADFRKAIRDDDYDSKGMDAQVSVFAAAEFSEHDLQTILSKGATPELIGAGIQTINDQLANRLLVRATDKSPNNPVAWAALAYRYYSLLTRIPDDFKSISAELANATMKLRVLAPSNSLPLYLDAAVQCQLSNYPAARDFLSEATNRKYFDPYSLELKNCLIQAAEAAGYSKYTARVIATGSDRALVAWYQLSKAILKGSPDDEKAFEDCFVLGFRVSQARSILEEAVGYSIQMKAMEKLPAHDFAADKAEIAKRKIRMRAATQYLISPKTEKVSEKRWVKYFNDSFEKSELSAIEALAKDNGDSF